MSKEQVEKIIGGAIASAAELGSKHDPKTTVDALADAIYPDVERDLRDIVDEYSSGNHGLDIPYTDNISSVISDIHQSLESASTPSIMIQCMEMDSDSLDTPRREISAFLSGIGEKMTGYYAWPEVRRVAASRALTTIIQELHPNAVIEVIGTQAEVKTWHNRTLLQMTIRK